MQLHKAALSLATLSVERAKQLHRALLSVRTSTLQSALAMWAGQQRGLFGEGFLPQCSVRFYLLTGACIGLSSILGDLIESFLSLSPAEMAQVCEGLPGIGVDDLTKRVEELTRLH